MMNKLKSTKRQLLRMLFLLPATALLLLAFRNGMDESAHVAAAVSTTAHAPNSATFDETKALMENMQLPADTVPERVDLLPTKVKAAKAAASDLKDIMIKKYTITILFRDGRKETYNTEIHSEKEAYEKKYGKLAGSTVGTYLSPGSTESVILVDIDKSTEGIAEIALAKVPVNTVALTQPVMVEGKPLNLIATTKPLTVTGYPLNEVTGTKPVVAATATVKLAATKPLVAAYPTKKPLQAVEKADILNLGGLTLQNEGQYILLDGKEYTTLDNTLKGTYRMTFLDKKEGMKKYGEKGKNGVIIAETIR